jgi:sugar phosphate permease
MLYASNQFMQIWLATEREFDEFAASTLFGSAYLLVAIPSGLLGGFVADWFTTRFATTKALFLCCIYLLAGPALFTLRLADPDSILFDVGLYGSIFLLTFPYGALLACVLDEAPPEIQSTATGFTMFSCNVLVIGGGTWFVGAAADFLGTQGSTAPLTTALLIGDVITLCCVGCFAWLHLNATNQATASPEKQID